MSDDVAAGVEADADQADAELVVDENAEADALSSAAAEETPTFRRHKALAKQVAARLKATLGAPRPDSTSVEDTRVLCIMMQKNEGVLLDPWLRYHQALFGADNLFVLDNGSTEEGTLERLRQAETDGVHVIRDFSEWEHFENKGRVFRDLARGLEDVMRPDFVMPLDCDEFVAVIRADESVGCTKEDIVGYLRREHLNEPGVMMIKGSFFNTPGKPGRYWFIGEPKCYFAQEAISVLSMGFHYGASRSGKGKLYTQLAHFHYRYKPYDLYVQSSKDKLAGRVEEFSVEAVRASKRSKGSHMVRHAFVGEEKYAEQFAKKRNLRTIDSLQRAFQDLGLDLPY